MQRRVGRRRDISTHAPAGGATRPLKQVMFCRHLFLLTPLREGRPAGRRRRLCPPADFYSRPCGRGDSPSEERYVVWTPISTHAPAGGATQLPCKQIFSVCHFYSRPCGRGDNAATAVTPNMIDFYSRPCGRGDYVWGGSSPSGFISTHAPAGGATSSSCVPSRAPPYFYSRPCGRGDLPQEHGRHLFLYFYSRPCGRGDRARRCHRRGRRTFLLTPLREGRLEAAFQQCEYFLHFYSRPCGRGDPSVSYTLHGNIIFLLTPLREGRPSSFVSCIRLTNFYSRPCGRGDRLKAQIGDNASHFYSRPCGRGDGNFPQVRHEVLRQIAER